jgi:hypothetical protein
MGKIVKMEELQVVQVEIAAALVRLISMELLCTMVLIARISLLVQWDLGINHV